MSDAYRAQLARRNAAEALQEAGDTPDSDRLPDPREEARQVLLETWWLFDQDVTAILNKVDAAGLRFCWKAPSDG